MKKTEYFARIAWSAEDIQEYRPEWTKEQAEKFLDNNDDQIYQAMATAGYKEIENILNTLKSLEGASK